MLYYILTDRLQFIIISYKWIYHIEDETFAGISNVQSISLRYTALMNMPPLAPVKNTLEQLHLDYNNISRIPHDYFVGFNNLQKLFICCNKLRDVPDITTLHNTLTFLELRENNIMSISGVLNGTTYRQLRYISLGSNIISILILTWCPFGLWWPHWV